MNDTVEQLNIENYDKSSNVWNRSSCPFTEQFREQVACGNLKALNPPSRNGLTEKGKGENHENRYHNRYT